MAPSCSANYYIESVPAQQTLGALVGIPKFVNPQRYGGSNIYTRTIGPVSRTGNIPRTGGMRSRSEIKEKVKKLIYCLKSQHITCEEAVKDLFEYVALNPSNTISPAAKQMNDADENKQKAENNIDYEIPLQRECSTDDGNEPYARLVDEQGNMNIAIVEGEGYRIAIVEIADGILVGDIHPLHHPRCPLQTLSIKECEQNSMSDERESLLFHEATTDVEEGRRGSESRKSGSTKRTPKQNGRKNQYTTKSPVRKRPHVVPERSLGMTLRKRKTRILRSPGIYDSEDCTLKETEDENFPEEKVERHSLREKVGRYSIFPNPFTFIYGKEEWSACFVEDEDSRGGRDNICKMIERE
ncbi:hypothetical protein DINM_001109 [Dirofilaria immitis]|nr:hypothetical protein [Dirofilaria immitis]